MPLPEAGQTIGLRNARFSPPRAPSTTRAHLVARIDESTAQLTLICAPAGFGKSALMQQSRKRFEASRVAMVWLRAERADNDLAASCDR